MNLHQLATLYELEELRLKESTPKDLAISCEDIKLTLLKIWSYQEYEIETINDVLYLGVKNGMWINDLFKALEILCLVKEESDE